MAVLKLESTSVQNTVQIGREVGKVIPVGTFVALNGILGAGKTQFVKGIACGLDEGGWAGLRSPTFTLMLSYHGGRCVLHHVDFYRLNESPELPGEIEDAIHTVSNIAVAEWADIFPEVWPKKHIRVNIDVIDDEGTRHIEITDELGLCPELPNALQRWALDS